GARREPGQRADLRAPKGGAELPGEAPGSQDHRMVLKLDDVIDWAVRFPRFLVSDRVAKRIGEKIKSRERPTVEEAAHLLRRRAELDDCNAGVIVDGLCKEREDGSSAASSRSNSRAADGAKAPSPAGALLCRHYETLRPVLAARV
ncbi:unnamed protein product, partial [Prorocentrum cordatum]